MSSTCTIVNDDSVIDDKVHVLALYIRVSCALCFLIRVLIVMYRRVIEVCSTWRINNIIFHIVCTSMGVFKTVIEVLFTATHLFLPPDHRPRRHRAPGLVRSRSVEHSRRHRRHLRARRLLLPVSAWWPATYVRHSQRHRVTSHCVVFRGVVGTS